EEQVRPLQDDIPAAMAEREFTPYRRCAACKAWMRASMGGCEAKIADIARPPEIPWDSKFFGSSPDCKPPKRASARIMGSRDPSNCADPASARYSRWRENHATMMEA